MRLRTALVLLVLVVVLGVLAWWQVQREERAGALRDVPLFEGIAYEDVSALRIESIEGHFTIRLERDAQGVWALTDPVQVQADAVRVDHLLRTVLARRATPVPDADRDARKLGFEPPRIVLDLVYGPDRKQQRLEIGALDLDRARVHVRARGMLLRTTRDIDTTLGLPLSEYKTHRALDIEARYVVEVHRSGRLTLPDETSPTDLQLDAQFDAGSWRASAPFSALLDPLGVTLWIQGCAELEIGGYVDTSDFGLAKYGLDHPDLTLKLVTLQGTSRTLHLAHAPSGNWYCRRADLAFVCSLDENFARLLGAPARDLLDHRVMRFAKPDVDTLRLRSGTRELRLTRQAQDWSVAERAAGAAQFGPALAAERGKVEDLITRIDRSEFASFDVDHPRQLEHERGALFLQVQDEVQGGVFGGERTGADGVATVEFQRSGDSIVALCDPALLALVDTPLEELRSLRLADISELEQKTLRIKSADVERVFTRDAQGLWSEQGGHGEARELHAVLDPLFFLRAARHLPDADRPALEEPVTVEFTAVDGHSTRFTIGILKMPAQGGPAGSGSSDHARDDAVIELEGHRAVLKDQDLHARLWSLLAPR